MKLSGNFISLHHPPILKGEYDQRIDYDVLERNDYLMRVENNNRFYDLHPLYRSEFPEYVEKQLAKVSYSEHLPSLVEPGAILIYGIFHGREGQRFLVTDAFGGSNLLAFMQSQHMAENPAPCSLLDIFSLMCDILYGVTHLKSLHGYLSPYTVVINNKNGLFHAGILCLSEEFYQNYRHVPTQRIQEFYQQLREFSQGFAFRPTHSKDFAVINPKNLKNNVDVYALSLIFLQLLSRNLGFELVEEERKQKQLVQQWLGKKNLLEKAPEMFVPLGEKGPESRFYQKEFVTVLEKFYKRKITIEQFYQNCLEIKKRVEKSQEDERNLHKRFDQPQKRFQKAFLPYYQVTHYYCQTTVPYPLEKKEPFLCPCCQRAFFPALESKGELLEQKVDDLPPEILDEIEAAKKEAEKTETAEDKASQDTEDNFQQLQKKLIDEIEEKIPVKTKPQQESKPLPFSHRRSGKINEEAIISAPTHNRKLLSSPLLWLIAGGAVLAGLLALIPILFSSPSMSQQQQQAQSQSKQQTSKEQQAMDSTEPSEEVALLWVGIIERVYYKDYTDILEAPPVQLHIKIDTFQVNPAKLEELDHYIDLKNWDKPNVHFAILAGEERQLHHFSLQQAKEKSEILVPVEKIYLQGQVKFEHWKNARPIEIGDYNIRKGEFINRQEEFRHYITELQRFHHWSATFLEEAEKSLEGRSQLTAETLKQIRQGLSLPEPNFWKLPLEEIKISIAKWPQVKLRRGDLWKSIHKDWLLVKEKLELVVE